MFEEKLEKIYDGYVEGTGIRKVVWRKTVDASPDIQREVGKRFNFSIQAFSGKKVLVIGLGTLGGEILKDLILAGVSEITCIDLDTTEYWNLQRCALLRSSDVGKSKALESARRGAELSPSGATVTGIHADVTMLGFGIVRDYDVVMSPVDSWAIRAYASAAASFYGKTHISCGTAVIDDVMCATVTIEPAGCNACYSCMVPGTLKEEEKKLSCLDYKPQTQPQVIAFSSAAAGLATQLAINSLLGTLDTPKGADGRPLACKYIIRELGKYDDRRSPVVITNVMSRSDDTACLHHRSVSETADSEVKEIHICRDCTTGEMISALRGVFGHGDEFMFDFRQSMLFYLAFPKKEKGTQAAPVSTMLVFEGSGMDPEIMSALPAEHVYFVSETSGPEDETRIVRMILE